MTVADHDKALVGVSIQNTVRDRHSLRVAAKIMVLDPVGFLLPRHAIVFEIADNLLLFRVHAEDGNSLGGEFLALLVDVLKLPIADAPRWRVLVSRFQGLMIDT